MNKLQVIYNYVSSNDIELKATTSCHFNDHNTCWCCQGNHEHNTCWCCQSITYVGAIRVTTNITHLVLSKIAGLIFHTDIQYFEGIQGGRAGMTKDQVLSLGALHLQ